MAYKTFKHHYNRVLKSKLGTVSYTVCQNEHLVLSFKGKWMVIVNLNLNLRLKILYHS